MSCPTTVFDNVCVEAQVTITPEVTVGDVITVCNGNPVINECPGTPVPFCSFMVSQHICVQIPLIFHASATAISSGIVCGTPGIGPCPSYTACTYTIGYFRTHPDVTNSLIAESGGTIILGSDDLGLSFPVDTTNAIDVLSFMTPEPPAPSDPPYEAQYQVLYAQLLAAKLNVINGATCSYITAAIAAADAFIASSPEGGTSGAMDYQAPLATFNNGNAPGCPGHCNDG